MASSIPASFKPSNKDIVNFFFSQGDVDENNSRSQVHVCICGAKRKKSGSSYQNLLSHVKSHHPGYRKEIFDSRGLIIPPSSNIVDMKANNIWKWMRFIVGKGTPFSWVEDEVVCSFSSAKSISVETLLRHMELVTRCIEREVTRELPDRFGLILDGWSQGSLHFIAIIACFYDSSTKSKKEFLLAFAPPLEEDNFTAISIGDLIRSTLQLYGASLENVMFFCGDNCSVNLKLSDDTGIPIIGCASHRLSLAVKEFLVAHENVLSKINQLMGKLKNLKMAARLREKTPLKAKKRNLTRWSSTFEMVKRYIEIKDFLPVDEEIAALTPTPLQTQQLISLFDGVLTEIEAVTKYIQDDNRSLLDVREVFDELMSLDTLRSVRFGENHLRLTSPIVHNAAFESAVVLLCNPNADTCDLTARQREAVSCFQKPHSTVDAAAPEDGKISVVLRAAKRRQFSSIQAQYEHVGWIPPTSNSVERFFSRCKQVYTRFRQRLTPDNLEMQLYMKMHSEFWFNKPSFVARAIHADDQ